MKRCLEILRGAWYAVTLRCEEADRIRCKGGDGTRLERVGARIHEGLCRSCRSARRRLEAIDQGLRSLGDSDDAVLPGDARARLRNAIENSEQ